MLNLGTSVLWQLVLQFGQHLTPYQMFYLALHIPILKDTPCLIASHYSTLYRDTE